jgi:hypothetical protein
MDCANVDPPTPVTTVAPFPVVMHVRTHTVRAVDDGVTLAGAYMV